jgi:hypothetical protein
MTKNHSQTCERRTGNRNLSDGLFHRLADMPQIVWHRLFFWEGSCRLHHIEQNISAFAQAPLKLNEKRYLLMAKDYTFLADVEQQARAYSTQPRCRKRKAYRSP